MRSPSQCVKPSRVYAAALALGAAASTTIPSFAAAQPRTSATPPSTPWSGWVRCELAVSGAGYADRQTHLWVVAPAPPTVQGAMAVQAATWSVMGAGSLSRTQGTQTLAAQWTTTVPGTSAPIAFTVRASDGRLLVRPWHAQLRARNAVSGAQQLTIDGKQQPPVAIGLEAFEWSFPALEAVATVTSIAGSSTPPVTGSIAPMQPADARATAACSWQLARGGLASSRSALTATATGSTPSTTPTIVTSTPPTMVTITTTVPPTTARTASGITPPPSSTITNDPLAGQATGGGWTVGFTAPPADLCSSLTSAGRTASSTTSTSTTTTSAPITSMRKMGAPLWQYLPPSQPATLGGCSLTQQVDALLAWLAGAGVAVTPSARPLSESECAQLAADVDQAYTTLILATQAQFDKLTSLAATPQEASSLMKQAVVAIEALRKQRDDALATILKMCEQVKGTGG